MTNKYIGELLLIAKRLEKINIQLEKRFNLMLLMKDRVERGSM